MPGSIYWKERSVVTLNNANFAALADLTAAALGTNVDVRNGGNCAGDFIFRMEMLVQWATVTSVTENRTAFEIFMLPSFDGTNFPEVNTTSGSSNIASIYKVGSFVISKAPTAGVDIRLASQPFMLDPLLFKPYLLNRSGFVTTLNATVKIASAQDQYS